MIGKKSLGMRPVNFEHLSVTPLGNGQEKAFLKQPALSNNVALQRMQLGQSGSGPVMAW